MRNVDISRMGYLLAVDHARFRDAIAPGTPLTVRARMTHLGSGYAAFDCAMDAQGRRVADAGIRIKLSEFRNEQQRQAVLQRLRDIGRTAAPSARTAAAAAG
jgi:3-hydroxyacyl-[acyl-carrier-protein] dehydratase